MVYVDKFCFYLQNDEQHQNIVGTSYKEEKRYVPKIHDIAHITNKYNKNQDATIYHPSCACVIHIEMNYCNYSSSDDMLDIFI